MKTFLVARRLCLFVRHLVDNVLDVHCIGHLQLLKDKVNILDDYVERNLMGPTRPFMRNGVKYPWPYFNVTDAFIEKHVRQHDRCDRWLEMSLDQCMEVQTGATTELALELVGRLAHTELVIHAVMTHGMKHDCMFHIHNIWKHVSNLVEMFPVGISYLVDGHNRRQMCEGRPMTRLQMLYHHLNTSM